MKVVFFDRNEMEHEELKKKIKHSTVEELVCKVNNSDDNEKGSIV